MPTAYPSCDKSTSKRYTQSSTFHTGYALWFGCGCQLRKKYQETICCQAKIRSGPACNMRLWCTSAPTSFSISNDRSISSEYQDAEHYADTKHLAKGLLDELLPGPVTVLLRRKHSADLPSSLNPNSKLLGIRVPNSDFIRAVARQYGHAIALTSANQSGSASTLDLNEFIELWDDVRTNLKPFSAHWKLKWVFSVCFHFWRRQDFVWWVLSGWFLKFEFKHVFESHRKTRVNNSWSFSAR